MTATELLKKVRTLEIKSKQLTNHLFTGEYHSAFKGQGMAFKEVKEYTAGDDIRFIDWNVSARMGNTYSKIFEEERELNVYLLVDGSASTLFGTHSQNKKDLITEICAVLAFSALNNNDKTGLIIGTTAVEKFIPPAKGRAHVLYLIRTLLNFKPVHPKTDLVKSLQYLNTVSKHKSIVFIVSDFADDGYQNALKIAAKRHDVIGIRVFDEKDGTLPNIGILEVSDAETGRTLWLDTSNPQVLQQYKQQFLHIKTATSNSFRLANAHLLHIATGEDYVKTLQSFFLTRK